MHDSWIPSIMVRYRRINRQLDSIFGSRLCVRQNHLLGHRLTRARAGGQDVRLVALGDGERVALVPVEGDFAAERVLVGAGAENLAISGVRHVGVDELTDRAARLESGVQGQPWFRPQETVLDFAFDFRLDLGILDVQEARDKRLIVVQHFSEHTERVHKTPHMYSATTAHISWDMFAGR